MLKNPSETIKYPESEKDFDKIIKSSLELELQKMENRNPGRNFMVLPKIKKGNTLFLRRK